MYASQILEEPKSWVYNCHINTLPYSWLSHPEWSYSVQPGVLFRMPNSVQPVVLPQMPYFVGVPYYTPYRYYTEPDSAKKPQSGGAKCFSSSNFVSTQTGSQGFFNFFWHGKYNKCADDVDFHFVRHIRHIASVMAVDFFQKLLKFSQQKGSILLTKFDWF